MTFEPYAKYWFWNKHTGKPDYLFVMDVTDDSVTFRRKGKRYTVSLEYASGKFFAHESDLLPSKKDTPSIRYAIRRGMRERENDDNGWTSNDRIVKKHEDWRDQD